MSYHDLTWRHDLDWMIVDWDPTTRINAIRRAVESGDNIDEYLPLFARRLRRDRNAAVRAYAAEALGEASCADPQIVRSLINALSDLAVTKPVTGMLRDVRIPEGPVAVTAARVLGRLHAKQAVTPLLRLIERGLLQPAKRHGALRRLVSRLLRNFRREQITPEERDDAIVCAALDALGDIGIEISDWGFGIVLSALKDPRFTIPAARVLRVMGPRAQSAAGLLFSLASDPSRPELVRGSACWALAAVDPTRQASVKLLLHAALNDPSELVRHYAVKGLIILRPVRRRVIKVLGALARDSRGLNLDSWLLSAGAAYVNEGLDGMSILGNLLRRKLSEEEEERGRFRMPGIVQGGVFPLPLPGDRLKGEVLTRVEVIEVVGSLGPKAQCLVGDLTLAMLDKNRRVQEAALKALKNIGVENLPDLGSGDAGDPPLGFQQAA